MYLWNDKKLALQLKNNQVTQKDVLSYYVAFFILTGVLLTVYGIIIELFLDFILWRFNDSLNLLEEILQRAKEINVDDFKRPLSEIFDEKEFKGSLKSIEEYIVSTKDQFSFRDEKTILHPIYYYIATHFISNFSMCSVMILSLFNCYKINTSGDNKEFFERYTALGLPMTIKFLVISLLMSSILSAFFAFFLPHKVDSILYDFLSYVVMLIPLVYYYLRLNMLIRIASSQ